MGQNGFAYRPWKVYRRSGGWRGSGARMPLAVGAASKVLVAFANPSLQEEILSEPQWPENVDPSHTGNN